MRTMTRIWVGNLAINAAKKRGPLAAQRNPVFVRTLSSWLRPSTNAETQREYHLQVEF